MIYRPISLSAKQEELLDFLIGLVLVAIFLIVHYAILTWMYSIPYFAAFLDTLNHCKDQPPGCL